MTSKLEITTWINKQETLISDEALDIILKLYMLQVRIPATSYQLNILSFSHSERLNIKYINLLYKDLTSFDPWLLPTLFTKLDSLDVSYNNLTSVKTELILTKIKRKESKESEDGQTHSFLSWIRSAHPNHNWHIKNLKKFNIMYLRHT